MRRSLSTIRRRVDQLTTSAALTGCGGKHQHYRVVHVHEDEPVPAWPEAEVGERCACGSDFKYFTLIDEFVDTSHVKLPKPSICW
jgi:hypothetical protein